MILKVDLKDFGPLTHIAWKDLGKINVVIGNNATGKTYLLKAMYVAIKSVEETGRGHNPKKIEDILADRLYWTFQTRKIGDLVRKGAGPAACSLRSSEGKLTFQFGPATEQKLIGAENTYPAREANSIFLPAKEVLSLFSIIKKSRDTDQVFGFDDTYLDLVRAIELEPTKGRNYEEFSTARRTLADMLNGKVVFENGEWYYKQGNVRFAIHSASEGIKKISILDRLLGNRYLSPDSIVFIDEPEAALHPEALSRFMEIIRALSESGIQFFVATHSYFVIKKLFLISKECKRSIPILSLQEDGSVMYDDLLSGMPENPIIGESVRLYEEEVELSFT
jgi:predicted ATPase